MGLPFPPPWEEGSRCNNCEDIIFSGSTPIFVYAFAQNLVKCPGIPPEFPDPNGVIRMTQDAIQRCLWLGGFRLGMFDYTYAYMFALNSSTMGIADTSGLLIFYHKILLNCQDHFVNQTFCGPPDFHGFSGGTVDCFW